MSSNFKQVNINSDCFVLINHAAVAGYRDRKLS